MVTARPRIDVIVTFGGNRLQLPFLIDTGADLTLIQPDHARQLLSGVDQDRQTSTPSDQFTISGIGSSAEQTTVRRVGLHFTDDVGRGYWFAQTILFANPASERSWVVPSLLGRDVLSRFDLNLSYDPPSVTLALND